MCVWSYCMWEMVCDEVMWEMVCDKVVCVCVSVCVEHLNRWKTSNPLAMVWNFDPWIFRFWTLSQQGGSESHFIHCPMKTVVWDCDIGTDHPDVPAISNFQFFVNGYRLSPEPACRIPKTGFKTKCDSCLYGFRNLIYCWLRQVEQLHLART